MHFAYKWKTYKPTNFHRNFVKVLKLELYLRYQLTRKCILLLLDPTFLAATCSGVSPLSLTLFGSNPVSNRNLTTMSLGNNSDCSGSRMLFPAIAEVLVVAR